MGSATNIPKWEDTSEVAQQPPIGNVPKWEDTSDVPAVQQEEPSQLESAGRGVGQGLLAGWLNKAIAGLSSGELQKINNHYGRSTDKNSFNEFLQDENLKDKLSQKANPITYAASNLIGAAGMGAAAPIIDVASAGSVPEAMKMGAAQGAISGAGYSEKPRDVPQNMAVSGAISGGTAGIMQKIANYFAPKFAENATGATGRELQYKFKPGSGERLLESNVVSALDTPESIARKAADKVNEASSEIGRSLEKIPAPTKEQLLQKIDQEISNLSPVSEGSEIKKLMAWKEDIQGAPKYNTGSDVWADKVKFDKKVNWKMRQDHPEETQINYLKSKILRNSVEDMAQPGSDLSKKFLADRQQMGLFNPIKEASEREAATLQQRKIGGLLDSLAGSAGAGYGLLSGGEHKGPDYKRGVGYGLAAAAGRRFIVPRIASTIASGLYSGNIPRAAQGMVNSSPWENLIQGQ